MQDRRMNENVWFAINQPLLLWLANTDYGRDLLCIPKIYNPIMEISKRHVKSELEPGLFLSDFRIGAKYANIIRGNWKDFKKAQKWYYDRFDPTHLLPFKYKSQPLLVATTTTVYPDPDPETTTTDGYVGRVGVDEAFSTIRAGAGNDASDSSTLLGQAFLSSSATSNQYDQLYRGIALFDTSSIADTDVVSAAVLSTYGFDKVDDGSLLTSAQAGVAVVASTPASNTALVNADYGQTGSTRFATDIAYDSYATLAYNDFTLNSDGRAAVSVTGVSKFGFRQAIDLDAGSPTWVSAVSKYVRANSADVALTTTDPKLVVTHAEAVRNANGCSLLGVGK